MSSITQTKAEVQKLIKSYNKLQAEAREADADEASLKAAQAEELVSQINILQIALSKTKSKQPVNAKVKKSPPNTGGVSVAEKKRLELENRINHIEDAQKRTRVQIQQLNQAKAELSRLQVEAEKAEKRRALFEKQLPKASDINKLKEQIKLRETQYQDLKKQFDNFQQQAHKDSELLRSERDTATNKLKQLEKEKMNLLRSGNNKNSFRNGFLGGAALGILGIVIFFVVDI
ncbi:hypothetical protein QUF50_02705 [Thiotrichales bacterium HSG1]|nr:hypothetical protein [Thiotrichales bacterium HSG1]